MSATVLSSRSAASAGRLLLTGLPCRASLRAATRHRVPAYAYAALSRYYASKSYPPHTIISMPALSPTMTAGNVGAWQKQAGDSLQPGDVLVEIETDKAQMDFEFQEEGTLAKILREAGEKDVAVGNPIAVMVEEGADIAPFAEFTLEDAGGGAAAPAEAEKKSEPAPEKQERQDAADSSSKPTPPPAPTEPEHTIDRLEAAIDREGLITPAAKKLALEKGVAIAALRGSGPGGRITWEDVEKHAAASPSTPAAPTDAAAAAAYVDHPVSNMRRTIATRLTQSTQQNPHYFVSSTLDVTRLLKLRAALNATGAADAASASPENGFKLSVTDFLIKALARALTRVPAANSHWLAGAGDGGAPVIREHAGVDVSVAVATPAGLVTPVVRGAHALGLAAISARVRELGARGRAGKLRPEEYTGGTFTISNMGMNAAVERFTAIINPPQAGILAVGAVSKLAVPAKEEGKVEWRDVITVTGSFDHKVVDGAVGAEFMRELKRAVENPLELML